MNRTLALSGGAAFGAYQAGAWAALENSGWTPRAVVGISIGAVNGFLIAKGASADEMRSVWLELPGDLQQRLKIQPGRLLWKELPLFKAWLDEVYEQFSKLPWCCDFQLVCASLPTFVVTTFQHDAVTREHLLAACALPGMLPPVRLNGRLYVDNGVVYPVPLAEARSTNADEIVVVDLLAQPPVPLVRPLRKIAMWPRLWKHRRAAAEREGQRVITIEHPQPLGGLRDCFTWSPADAERLFDLGEKAGRAALLLG